MTIEHKPDRDEVADRSETDAKADLEETDAKADVEETAVADTDDATNDPKQKRRKSFAASSIRRYLPKLGPALLAVALTAAAALAASLYYFQYRTDQATDAAAAHAAVVAASDGTVAILSLSPDSLERDIATTKSRLTGDFLSDYTKVTQQIALPAVKQKAMKTTATVIKAGVSEMHPDSAVVLVFVNLKTTTLDRPDPSLSASGVLVTMKKVNGAWLISRFDAV